MILLSLFLSFAMATEPEPWEQQLTQQTQIKSGLEYAKLATHGYVLMDVVKTSLLDSSASEFVNVNLPLGNDYVLMAVCDNDCDDLDLSIVKNSVELSTDTTEDDWPLIEISPVDTPDYQIKVKMYKCSTPNCGYQLSVWQKPGTPQVDAPAPAPTPATACSVSEGAAHTVTLLEPGSGSKNLLRFLPTLGTRNTYSYTQTGNSKTFFGSVEQFSTSLPTITIVMDTEVTATDGDTFTMDFEYKSVDVGNSPESSTKETEMVEFLFAKIVGFKGKSTLTDRGLVLDGSIAQMEDAGIEVNNIAASIKKNMLAQVAVSLPVEPVGVGARWKVESQDENDGFNFSQVAVVTLKSLESGRPVMDIEVTQCAGEQKLERPEGEHTLQSMNATGKGTKTISFYAPLPIKSSMNLSAASKMISKVSGQTIESSTTGESGSTMKAGRASGD